MKDMSSLIRTPQNSLPSETQSNPDLTVMSDSEKSEASGTSRKRKDRDYCLSSQMESLLTMFQDLKQEQATSFANMESNIAQVKKQNDSAFSMLNDIRAQQTQLQGRIETLEIKEQATTSAVDNMGRQAESLQRKLLETSVEIRNIPTENTQEAIAVVEKIHTALNLDYNKCFIRSLFRARGKQNEPRPIVVEFCTVSQKTDLLRAIKNFNAANKTDKFNTGHFDCQPKNTVFINERLTPKCSQLRFLARSGVKRGDFNSSWTSGGRLFVRKQEGQPAVEITDPKQLENTQA
ncbi:uncharacterized protein LOC134741440 [Cydia strobilella]|uniref:uncharacterized protein LOC134741440 n=1 Tax=Cydia strobilella TaxID=1100964 RepID=UPI003004F3F6